MKRNFKFCLYFILFFATGFQTKAQQLTPGSVAFIAFQSDQPIAFAFVNLVDIQPGTQISFTDNKWGYNHLVLSEQTVIWTSPDTVLPVGTIVRLRDNGSPNMQVTGAGTTSGRLYIMGGQGDQIFAYNGPQDDPSFIAGISNSNWQPTCDSLTFFQFRTCLPSPLVNGQTAVSFTNTQAYNVDNGYLAITPFDATGPEMLSIINNINYWYLDNGAGATWDNWPDWNSGSTQPFASPINFTASEISVTEGGALGTITLHIETPQFTPQTVILNVLEFPGITSTDYATTPPSFGSLNLEIPANTQDFSFTVQALIDGFAELDETVTFVIASVSGGLVTGNQDAIAVTIINTDQNFGQISFVEDTVWVTEGSAPGSIVMNINPATPATFNVIVEATDGAGISTDYFTTPANFSGQLLLQTTANSPFLSFTATPYNDTQIEADEYVTFTITLVSPAGLQIGNASSVVMVIKDNDNIPAFTIPRLVINELNAFNTDYADENNQFDDWIELYNNDTVTVSIAGYHITNNIDSPVLFTIPSISSQTTMPPASFKILWADQNTSQGPLHLNFTLNPTGGFVGLFAPDGESLVDATNYPAMAPGQTFGRFLDGNDNWKKLYYPTPGAPNSDSIPLGVYTPASEMGNQQLSLFPNPANEYLNVVKPGAAFNGGAVISIVDLTGREVNASSIELTSGKSWKISTVNLAHGCYMVVVRSKDSVSTALFNKE